MAARKKTTLKAKVRKTARKSKSAITRIEEELPKSLRDFGKQVRKNLNRLERDIERAIPAARRRTARLIRDASHELGRIEERGEAAWRRRASKVGKDAHKLAKEAQGLLRKLERDVAPPKPKQKKKVARKVAARSAGKVARKVAAPSAGKAEPAGLPTD